MSIAKPSRPYRGQRDHELLDFCNAVEARVEEQFDVQDGGDFAFNLVESGVLSLDTSIDEAARIVAQHILQA